MFVYELSNLKPSGQRHAAKSGSVKNCMCGNDPLLHYAGVDGQYSDKDAKTQIPPSTLENDSAKRK